jgi:hypothetical protein
MVLVPFRAIPVGVYAESGFSATAENTARTDFYSWFLNVRDLLGKVPS